MMKPQTGELVFFWILFGIAGALTFLILSPYLTPIFLAGVFAVLFSPIYKRTLKWSKGNASVASLATVLIILCAVLIPLIFLGILMFQEVLSIYNALSSGNFALTVVDNAISSLETQVRVFVPAFEIHSNVYVYLEEGLRWTAAHLNLLFSGILSFVFQIFIVVITMFFFFRDGEQLHAFALKWSPLSDSYDDGIITKIEHAVSSVVEGALATAIAQGVLVGIGFAIFGIPNPVLWGVVATIAALIPLVGTSLVTMPAAVWLLLTHHIGPGLGLIAWSILCVGLVDNALRPYVIKRGMDVHPLLILLSVFGGLVYFGPVGFLAGPIVLAFFFALLDVYPLIVKGRAIKEPDVN